MNTNLTDPFDRAGGFAVHLNGRIEPAGQAAARRPPLLFTLARCGPDGCSELNGENVLVLRAEDTQDKAIRMAEPPEDSRVLRAPTRDHQPDKNVGASDARGRGSLARIGFVAVALLSFILGSCVKQRTPQTFCAALERESQRLIQKYEGRESLVESASNDSFAHALSLIGSGLSAYKDLIVLLDRVADESPEEIRAEVESLRDSLQATLEDLKDLPSNPFGSIFGALLEGLSSMGSFQAVEEYAKTHC